MMAMSMVSFTRFLVRASLQCTLLCSLAAACLPAFALDPGKAFHHYVRNMWSIQHGLPQISV